MSFHGIFIAAHSRSSLHTSRRIQQGFGKSFFHQRVQHFKRQVFFFQQFFRILNVLLILFQFFHVYDNLLMHDPNRLADGHRIIVKHPKSVQNVIHFLLYVLIDHFYRLQYLLLFYVFG